MNVEFFKAANNEDSCEFNKIKLHSGYNPSREAENFIKNIQVDFNPPAIIITGPCISYTAVYLKQRFPKSKLYAIQYSKDFKKYDNLWEKTFYSSEEKTGLLSEKIFSAIGDEVLISTLFISWTPSQKAFQEEYEYTWTNLKTALLKARNVLNTRSFFSKRWIKNSIRFCIFSENNGYIQRGKNDILLCASGPSLYSSLDKIKEVRKNIFLICVSSALSPLVSNGIIPDLCITTDGGFWAKLHLQRPLMQHPEIAIAMSAEAAANAGSFLTNTIIPLNYLDGTSSLLLKANDYSSMNASRNGTVSGTAALLCLSITQGNVFFCGLDLSENKSFIHTQPNQLEIRDSLMDFRLKTKETRLFPQSLKSQSLEIYKNWFSSADFSGRLFRLSKTKYNNSLKNIKDVDWNFFNSNSVFIPKGNPSIKKYSCQKSLLERKKSTIETLQANTDNKEFLSEAFPVDMIMKERYMGTDKEQMYETKLKENTAQFISEMKRYISK